MMISIVYEILQKHDYKVIEFLNKDAFGSCYIVYSEKYKMNFVCKVSSWHKLNAAHKQSYEREVNALTSLNHPNIVRTYDVFTGLNYLFIILEYCTGGNLLEMLHTGKNVPQTEYIKYFRQIADALNNMHQKGFAHCDVKLSNIIIDEFGRAKLCDFGLTQFIDTKSASEDESSSDESDSESSCETGSRRSRQLAGTMNFIAPEVMMEQVYDPFKADVWSFGVTFYALATGRLPFRGSTISLLTEDYKKGINVNILPDEKVRSIIERCLVFEPENRAEMSEIRKLIYDSYKPNAAFKPKASTQVFRISAHSTLMGGYRRLKAMPKTILC